MFALTLFLFVALALLLVIDCGQTRTIAANPHRFHEKNPILRRLIISGYHDGAEAAQRNVVAYFIVAGLVILVLLVALQLLAGDMATFIVLGLLVLVQLGVVLRNASLGIAPFPDDDWPTKYRGSDD